MEQTVAVARRVLEAIFELRNAPLEGGPSGEGGEFHAAQIGAYVRRGRPIELVLPAFPAKSSNPEKTLGVLPDYGEVLALRRLDRLCVAIGKVHPPGARLIICSDGRVFSDLVQVSDEAVNRYAEGIRGIILEYGLTRLATYNLDDVFPGAASYDEMRQALVDTYAEPLEDLRGRTAREEEARRLFDGIHRFLFEDLVVLRPGLSRNKARLLSKDLAYRVIQRSNAWSNLVAERFPEAVRLSIHPQPVRSRKIGVRLLPSPNIWRTPWHSAVLYDGSRHSLVRRREAEQMRAVLVQADGRYPYFVSPGIEMGGGADASNALN